MKTLRPRIREVWAVLTGRRSLGREWLAGYAACMRCVEEDRGVCPESDT